MTVAKILAKKGNIIISASADDSLEDVSKILADKKIGAVMILNDEENLVGIVSERDIVRRLAKSGTSALDEPASQSMTKEVVSCDPSENVNQAMEKMSMGRFRHLPVMSDGRLVGIISIGDVVKRKIEQVERDAEDLKRYIAS